MEDYGRLRARLVAYMRKKFSSRPAIALHAEDIVDEAFAAVLAGRAYEQAQLNFGYLSVAATRVAYRYWRARDAEADRYSGCVDALECVTADEFVDELCRAEDAAAVLDSLDCLRDVERIVVEQRYYGDYTFAEIAARNGLKLNTVLSHHRRALERLRRRLSAYLY